MRTLSRYISRVYDVFVLYFSPTDRKNVAHPPKALTRKRRRKKLPKCVGFHLKQTVSLWKVFQKFLRNIQLASINELIKNPPLLRVLGLLFIQSQKHACKSYPCLSNNQSIIDEVLPARCCDEMKTPPLQICRYSVAPKRILNTTHKALVCSHTIIRQSFWSDLKKKQRMIIAK